jgi:hypothetical protein
MSPGLLTAGPSRKGGGVPQQPNSLPCGRGRGGVRVASEPLRQLLQAARSAGIRVSAAEGIDAARAVQWSATGPHSPRGHPVTRAGEDTGREEPVRRMLRSTATA